MANIVVDRAFWVSIGNATDMQPGQIHNWIWGLGNLNEAITITAFPLASFNTGVIIASKFQKASGDVWRNS
jgi:hypothetical protein